MYIVKHCEGVTKLFFSFVGNHPRMIQYTVFKPLKHLWGQKLVEFLRKPHQVNSYIQRPLSAHSITGPIMLPGFLHQHSTDTVQNYGRAFHLTMPLMNVLTVSTIG